MVESKIGKMLAGVSLVVILSYAFTFATYKSFNRVIDNTVNEILDFLRVYNVNLTVETFWFILALIFLVLVIIVVVRES